MKLKMNLYKFTCIIGFIIMLIPMILSILILFANHENVKLIYNEMNKTIFDQCKFSNIMIEFYKKIFSCYFSYLCLFLGLIIFCTGWFLWLKNEQKPNEYTKKIDNEIKEKLLKEKKLGKNVDIRYEL